MSALALPTRSQCAEDRGLPNDAFTRPQRAQAAGRISLVTKLCSTLHGCQYSRAQLRNCNMRRSSMTASGQKRTNEPIDAMSASPRMRPSCGIAASIALSRKRKSRRHLRIIG